MKTKITAALLAPALLMLLFSCSPVPAPDRMGLIPVASDSLTVLNVTAASESAEIFFTPVMGAESYEIRYCEKGSDETRSTAVSTSSYSQSGVFKVLIRPLSPNTGYTVSAYAKNSANTDFIMIGQTDFSTAEAGMLEYAPVAWLSYRTKDVVAIDVNMVAGITYSVDLENADGETIKTAAPEDGKVEFDELVPDDSYKAVVKHGTSADDFSAYTTGIAIPEYSTDYDTGFTISYQNGVLDANGIPAGAVSLKLCRDGVPVQTSAPEYPSFQIVPSTSFESAVYNVVATTPGGETSSCNLLVTSGIALESRQVGYQDIRLAWNAGGYEDGEVIYNITVSDGISAEPVIAGGKATLVLDGLDSKTGYRIGIEAVLPDKRTSTTLLDLTTKDFSGIYQWINTTYPLSRKVGNFAVTVVNAPSESAYAYYIYVNDQDCYYDGSSYRILPLIDNSYQSGETMPEGMIPYSSSQGYAQSYRWNAGKWNTTSMSPAKWRIADTVVSADTYKTTVNSSLAGSSSELPTDTSWTFSTDENGDPVLYFKNYSSSLLVAMGLYTNPDFKAEGVDKNTFLLKRIADI